MKNGFKILNKDFTVDMNNLDQSQEAAVISDQPEIVIRAAAGSGKTHTLITAVAKHRYDYLNDRICAITFTRAARAEMKSRLEEMGIYDVEVTTIHVWARNMLDYFADKYDIKIRVLEENEIKLILQDIVKNYILRSKVRSVNINILYTYITGSKTMDITDNYRRTLNALEERYIQYKRSNGLYDFTDYPQYLWDVMTAYNEYINHIDALFVDEFQDVDKTQFKIFERVNANKKFYIGDPWQCQPAGTQILIRSKEGCKTIPIEKIEVGTPIVFYDQKQGYVSGTKTPHNALLKTVQEVQKHSYSDNYMIKITSANGQTSQYTANHRTFVRFNKKPDHHVVYLMCDNNYRFRVGKVPMFYSGKSDKTQNPWRDKMRAEGCEKIWLLKIFDNDHDARVEETKISYQYGIPQTCWQTQKVQWTKEDLEYIYSDLDTKKGAIECLKKYQLDIRYPLIDDSIEWSKRSHFTSNASSEIYAINIIPEFMSCLVFEESPLYSKKFHGEEIIKVEKIFIDKDNPVDVYALKVEGETYVADNIITHNSIYIFRSADGEVFNKLDNFELFKLKYNYRSFQEIIDYATTVYESAANCITDVDFCRRSSVMCSRGYGGVVSVINAEGECFQFKDGDYEPNTYLAMKNIYDDMFNGDAEPMVLCRTNKQVRALQELGITNVSTVHQAKGLEYPSVVVVDMEISEIEDLNVAYVALTRAKDSLLVTNWGYLENYLKKRNSTRAMGFSSWR